MRGLASAVLVGLLVLGGGSPLGSASEDPLEAFGLVRLDGGIEAPEFTLKDLRGAPVSVSAASGAPTLLVFWTTW